MAAVLRTSAVSRPGAIVSILAAAMNEASDAEMDIIESPAEPMTDS